MSGVFLFGILTIALLAALLWLWRRSRVDRGSEQLLQSLSAEELLPHHYRFFPQVRQALSAADEAYLEEHAGPEARRKAVRIRREAALEFLTALREDYRRFNRLARALTTLAPSANPQREMERLRLGFQFGFGWRLVWLNLWLGGTPLRQMQLLSDQIASLSTKLESSIKAWQAALAASQVRGLKV